LTITTLQYSGSFSGTENYQIYYEDTDFTGYVYHSNYLKYFERSREHILGIDFLKQLYKEGIHFVVAEVNLKYRAAANHGDLITVETEVKYNKSPLIHFVQTAKRDQTTIVDGIIQLAIVDASGRPICPPDLVVAEFTKYL
jgi:acyl-CoA thioester hydrolase